MTIKDRLGLKEQKETGKKCKKCNFFFDEVGKCPNCGGYEIERVKLYTRLCIERLVFVAILTPTLVFRRFIFLVIISAY